MSDPQILKQEICVLPAVFTKSARIFSTATDPGRTPWLEGSPIPYAGRVCREEAGCRQQYPRFLAHFGL